MSTTIPALDPVTSLATTDVVMITHSNGTTEKLSGANLISEIKRLIADEFQKQNLSSAIAGETTVEGALNGINTDKIRKSLGKFIVSTKAQLDTTLDTLYASIVDGEVAFAQIVDNIGTVIGGGNFELILYRADPQYGEAIFFNYGSTNNKGKIFMMARRNSAWTDLKQIIPDNYSTSETLTNKVWIDGKPIYRKVVDCGALPNATIKRIPHNISNIGTIVYCDGFALSASGTFHPLPYIGTDTIEFYVTTSQVVINTSADRSNLTGYATVEYTKTTD